MILLSSDLERDAVGPDVIPASVPTAITGVGLVDAGIGTARVLSVERPASLLFLGTCGAHVGAGLAVGDIVIATSVALGSGDVASGAMRVPTLMPAVVYPETSFIARVHEAAAALGVVLHPARVSCTLGITENELLAAALARDADVENLEAYAVLRAAAGLPAAVLLGVTNIVGPGGGAGWSANYRALMRAVAAIGAAFYHE